MAEITDLQYDLLAYIMILMVQSSDGSENLARTITVCKSFRSFAQDETILKAVVFDEARATSCFQLFQKITGLLFKCARAGNLSALFLLAKIMLLSTSESLDLQGRPAQPIYISNGQIIVGLTNTRSKPKGDTPVSLFLRHFMPKQARTISTSTQSFVHYDLAKFFLKECTIYHLPEMQVHLDKYIDYFGGAYNENCVVLHQAVAQMCSSGAHARDLKALEEIKERLDECVRVVKEVGTKVRERWEDDLAQRNQRYEALAEATRKYPATILVLKAKCREIGVNFEEYFGASANLETFNRHVAGAALLFQFYRYNALLTFTLMLEFESDDQE
ncbi:hypothetical protein LguiA_009633 [Lonicera macranthoides]